MPPASTKQLHTWIIGSAPNCDVVIDHPNVSGRHCRLTEYEQRFSLEDLASTNGTYVNHQRLAPNSAIAVVPERDQVTLGLHVPLPWPKQALDGGSRPGMASAPRVIRIGRSPDSDVVLDYPMISWNHAEIIEQNGQYRLRDLNSTNGTALNQIGNRITEATLNPSDDVYLGSYKIPVAQLVARRRTTIGEAAYQEVAIRRETMVIGRDPDCDQPLNFPMISWHHARITRSPKGILVEDLGSLNGTFVNGTRIRGTVPVAPGQEIGLGSFRFRLKDGNTLERRQYLGNVSIQAVDVIVNARDGRRLLDPVSLMVYPSELVALMGPAGAGKTTLLKALNGYQPPVHGNVLFNGVDLYAYYDRFRQQMGYVPQDDIVHASLTVAEALRFSTKLRTDLSDQEIDRRINEVLEQLRIADKKHSLIGSPERPVLSGGERKRVNIAMELMSDTPVLFLDEPTSGLSSYDADGVVELLRELSRQGKTIITTIHQPSPAVFRKFDNLIMIRRDSGKCGALVYFGPAYPDSIYFFNPQRAQAAAGKNGEELNPEWLLEGVAQGDTAGWCGKYVRSRYRKQFVEDRAGKVLPGGDHKDTRAVRRFSFSQWLPLAHRTALLKYRDKAQLALLLLQAPIFAILIVLVYNPLPRLPTPDLETFAHFRYTFAQLTGKLSGIHFLMVVAAIWFGCNNAARDVVGEWTVYQRERMVNLKLPSYVGAKFAVLVVLCVFQCLTLFAIVHFCCNLAGDPLSTAAILILASLVGASLGLAISARSSSTESAIALLPIVLLPVIALGGGVQPAWQIGNITYAVPSRWAFEANVVEEAKKRPAAAECLEQALTPECVEKTSSCFQSPLATGESTCVDLANKTFPQWVDETAEDKVPRALDSHPSLRHPSWQAMAWLAGMLVFFQGLVLTFLRLRDIH